MRAATGFHRRDARRAATEEAFVRIRRTGPLWLATMANAFDSGFATCWPTGSRWVLDRFDRAWDVAGGAPASRLARAFHATSEAFGDASHALAPRDPDFPDDVPSAVLLAAVWDGTFAHVRWLGGDVAWVVRGGEVVNRTRPHTLRARYRVPPSARQAPNVVLRAMGADRSERPEQARWPLGAGDALVLLSHGSALRDPLGEGAFAVLGREEVATAAELLARRGGEGGQAVVSSVAVLLP